MNEKTMSKSVGIVLIAGLMSLVLGSSLLPTPPANAADVLLVSVAIIASPDTICVGQSTNISWSSFDATSVSINQGIGSVSNFGSQNVSPTQTTTYTITGTNPTGGYGVASATVYVTGPCSTPTPTPTPTWTPTPTPTPYLQLSCAPSVQTAQSGQWITFSAVYPYPPFYVGNLTWSAVGGSPSTGTGGSFGTRFYTSSISETRIVTVNDGYQTASCVVYVYGPQPTWTPTPTPVPTLQCSPSYSNANSGEAVYLSAWGGNGSYSWHATDGYPASGRGSNFSTRFYDYNNSGNYHNVSVRSGDQTAYCTVYVYGQSTWTPTPTPTYNWFSFDHTVRNLTRGGSGTSVNARNGDRLQFVANITTGSQYAEDVHVRDWLPQYVSYVYGSTTVDGAAYQDGIATGNSNSSLALGMLSPNRTYTVRFEGTLNGAPNVTLTNSINAHVRYAVDQSRTSTIRVTGSSATPTPTVTVTPVPSASALTLSLLGRNRTVGQSVEASTVRARGNDTIELVLRVSNAGSGYLTNVTVTDYLPAGLRYAAGSTTLNGYGVGDGITSSGISVGSLASGQTATVKFSVVADAGSVPSWGEVVVIDRAQARADGAATVAAQMNVILGKNLAVASISGVKTGPADSILLSLVIAALATSGYAMYARSNSFGRRMSLVEIRTAAGRSMNFSR